MGCLGLDPTVQTPPTVWIGRDNTLNVEFRTMKGEVPIGDLGLATEILANFLNSDGTFLTKRLTTSGIVVTDTQFWKAQILLNAADVLLKPSPVDANGNYLFSDIECTITLAGRQMEVNLLQSVTIRPRPFPTAP